MRAGLIGRREAFRTAAFERNAIEIALGRIVRRSQVVEPAIVMVSHDVESLRRCTDRIAFIGDGKILSVEPFDTLKNNPHPLIADYFSHYQFIEGVQNHTI